MYNIGGNPFFMNMGEIKSIVKEELKKFLFDRPSLNNALYRDLLDENYKIDLDEGLYKTYPPKTARRYIMDLFNLDDSQIIVYSKNGGLPEEKRLIVSYYDGYDNKEKMKKAMLLCGYTMSKETRSDNGIIQQSYIPINLPNLNDVIRKYKFITHVTPIYNKDKILSIGFVPKSKNEMFSYNDRVFFFKGDTPPIEILYQVNDFDDKLKNKRNNHIYTLFSISTGKIPKNVNFHTDLTYPCGIYTTENVPPSCIANYQDFDIIKLKDKIYGKY